jgi:hypothetical protein
MEGEIREQQQYASGTTVSAKSAWVVRQERMGGAASAPAWG